MDPMACWNVVPGTQFTQQLGAGHQCGPRCQTVKEWGNVWRCLATGAVHVCDANCDQRIPLDRYSTICKMSRKLAPLDTVVSTSDSSRRKRTSDSPRACSSRKLNKCDQVKWNGATTDDAMVM